MQGEFANANARQNLYEYYHFIRLTIQFVYMIIWNAHMQAGNINRAYNKVSSLHVVLIRIPYIYGYTVLINDFTY